MAVSNVTTLPLFDQVNQEIQSNDEDRVFWWGAFGQSLATLLKTSQYSGKEQLYYLRWFQEWIMGSLGPRSVDGKPYYGSSFTYDGSPVEYSLNWKQKKVDQTIRFTTEPCSQKAGTAADPLNQLAAKDLLTAMAKDVSGIDLTRFKLFWSGTNVPDEAAEEVLSKLPPGHPRACVLLAFDLEHGEIVAKAYFNPALKAICMGTPTKTIVFDVIRKCNGPAGSYDASIAVLDGYLETFDASEAPQIFMLSNDCVVDSPTSRIKVYVTSPVNTLAMAKDAFHLGGRLSGPATKAGLKAVGDLWCHIFGLSSSDSDIDDKEVLPTGSRCVFVFEMRPTTEGQNGSDIEVKMHMPASWFGKTDAQACEVLADWFRTHGHPDLAARYQPDLISAL
ncbi:hypothetical protein MMC18_004807 [Xylographa bjoerkii]|nr:hypothetical protein [Xylographa bjoerkii]